MGPEGPYGPIRNPPGVHSGSSGQGLLGAPIQGLIGEIFVELFFCILEFKFAFYNKVNVLGCC